MSKELPEFVACGLKLGVCGYQIPYDMIGHEEMMCQIGRKEFIKEAAAWCQWQQNRNRG